MTDEGSEQPRPTKNVDISVQISSYREMEKLREILATKQIYPAPSESILYRYIYEDILIDFIPFEATPLGPTNSWLKFGFEKSIHKIVGETEINILPVSLFLASKWEAFKNRGNDPRTSPDFEDIIHVIDNNKELLIDVEKADKKVQFFLKNMSLEILNHHSMDEIIECHINPLIAEERKKLVIKKLKGITYPDI